MSFKPGTYCGGLRNLESLRERCVISEDGCWHLRLADGRPLPTGLRQAVWVHGFGACTSTRASWFFKTGKWPAPGWIVFRTCESYDCVNPKHLKAGAKSEQGRLISDRGHERGKLVRIKANMKSGRTRAKLTIELAQWARESGQPAKDIAHAFGISRSRAIAVKAGLCWRESLPGSSAFNQAGAAA